MSDINAIIASIGDAIVLANKQSKEELKAYIKSELGTYKFSGTQIRQNSLPGAAIGRWGVPYTKVSGLQAEVARIAVAEISSATIDYAQISNVRIKTADIDDAAITTAKIGDAAITSAKIGDAEIGTAKIANAAIKTANIDLGAITTALIQEGAVGSVQIADGSITDAKIVELTANKITAGELSAERLIIVGNDKSIVYAINEANGTAQLSATTIDGGSITQRSITADRIVSKSITAQEIAARTLTANEILAQTITGNEIASDTVDARIIKAGSVQTSHLVPGFGNQLVIAENPAVTGLKNDITGETNRAQAVENEIKAFTDTAKGFFIFDIATGELTIGKTDSEFASVHGPDRLSFKQSGSEIAYISNNKLYISMGQILNILTIGDKPVSEGGDGFVDLDTSNGGLRAAWRAS